MRKRRTRRKPSKPIKLHPEVWVRQVDVKIARQRKLKQQGGKCAVTGANILVGTLDHSHENGKCRGILEPATNALEGRFRKLFKRSKIEEKYNISFPDFLINLGNYLKMDNTNEKYHYAYMTDFRKVIRRLGKDELIKRLYEEFSIPVSDKITLDEIVQIYMTAWVHKLEKEILT